MLLIVARWDEFYLIILIFIEDVLNMKRHYFPTETTKIIASKELITEEDAVLEFNEFLKKARSLIESLAQDSSTREKLKNKLRSLKDVFNTDLELYKKNWYNNFHLVQNGLSLDNVKHIGIGEIYLKIGYDLILISDPLDEIINLNYNTLYVKIENKVEGLVLKYKVKDDEVKNGTLTIPKGFLRMKRLFCN